MNATLNAPTPWSWGLRTLFRFFFCYWTFWALPANGRVSVFTAIPGTDTLFAPYTSLWHAIVQWTGGHVFSLSTERLVYKQTGSGDTIKDWIEVFCYLVFSIIITVVWSVLDRKRTEYDTLYRWLRTLVRYNLGLTLLAYGGAKIIPLQFQEPRFYDLLKPYGQASPMGVLWRFMGSSLAYTVFAGLAEYVSGALLFFRRTTVLGAMAAAGVMLNVAVLNYCYDVPVKLYSTNLLLMALFLLAPDATRLMDVLLLNRAVPAVDPGRDRIIPPRFKYSVRAMVALKVIFMLVIFGGSVEGMWGGYQETYAKRTRPPLYGLYEVETFSRNGVLLPPLLGDAKRWHRVGFERPNYLQGWHLDESQFSYQIQLNQLKHSITLKLPDGGIGQLQYSEPTKGKLELEGMLVGEPVQIRLRAIDASQFLLLNRGFHWVQEFPFNR